MTRAELLEAVGDPDRLRQDGFDVLAGIAALFADGDALAGELVIRAHDHAGVLGAERVVLDALTRHAGLLPYLPQSGLGVADALAVEVHRPRGLEDFVLHVTQAAAYRRLLAGEDLVLMAPTSFGKSLLVDALIAAGHLGRVLVIVPSIALIDETRARLQRRFGDERRVVTHASQPLDERALIVMTQERALELTREEVPALDLLVVDEFYKLDPRMDPERSALLNTAFDRLRLRARQVFLLGPNVGRLPEVMPGDFHPAVVSTDVRTTALDVQRIDVPAHERPGELARILRTYDGPTLVYCRAPAGCRRTADGLLEAGLGGRAAGLPEAARWLREHVHPKYRVADYLQAGIGVHHARMPRWLAQHVVRAFDDGRLDVLICTSTLIEGVNTAARNVVLYENRVGDATLDLFSFNNIAGRSGRMWRHFVGRVFHFHPKPRGPLPDVDLPVLTQSKDAPAGLLLELPAGDRTAESAERLRAVLDQDLLSEATLRANVGIPPERQLALAAVLDENPYFYEGDLSWTGMPDERELGALCRLIVDHLLAFTGMRHGVASARQLSKRLDRLRANPDLVGLVADEAASDFTAEVDEAVESVMQFQRSWAQFEFPRVMRALERIAREVLGRAGCTVGDFSVFAAATERLFLPPYVQILDEYGIPPQVGLRLFPHGRPDLDAMLAAVREAAPETVEDPFERELLTEAQRRL